MTLRIGSRAPDFEASSTEGAIRFHDWIGDSWCVLFSHPTELGYMARLKPEFAERNCKIVGLSVDPVEDHARWAKDIEDATGHAPNYPLIGDADLNVAKLYGMLPDEAGDSAAGRTAADNQTVRTIYVIAPDRTIKAMLSYPMSTGRNFDEVLRLLDSVQLTAKHKVATPVNWKQGEDVIIVPSISDEEAREMFPDGWKAPKYALLHPAFAAHRPADTGLMSADRVCRLGRDFGRRSSSPPSGGCRSHARCRRGRQVEPHGRRVRRRGRSPGRRPILARRRL